MDAIQYAILGLIQGLTEFLPVSSTGHLIVARELFGFATDHGLAVDAVLQLATAFAVLVYFFEDILNLAYTALYKLTGRNVPAEEGKLFWAIVIGTIPAVLFGLLLESTMETAFRSAHLVAWALIAGSVVFVAAEYFSKRFEEYQSLDRIGVGQGIVIGLFQCLALVPGMSRSGMTISGGLFLGLSRSDAARFGFLLSVPILFGTGLKKLYDLGADGFLVSSGEGLIVGSVVAFISGLVAIHILMVLVRKTPLTVFAAYRVALAFAILFYI